MQTTTKVGYSERESSTEQRVQLFELALNLPANLIAEREDARVGNPVEDAVALLAPPDDAGLEQNGEMLGHVLLRSAGGRDELGHAGLLVAQPVEQAEPRRLGDRSQAMGDQLGQLFGNGVWESHRSGSIQYDRTVV